MSVFVSFIQSLFYIGKSFYSRDVGLIGFVDEFRIWSGALDATTILSNYKAGGDNVLCLVRELKG